MIKINYVHSIYNLGLFFLHQIELGATTSDGTNASKRSNTMIPMGTRSNHKGGGGRGGSTSGSIAKETVRTTRIKTEVTPKNLTIKLADQFPFQDHKNTKDHLLSEKPTYITSSMATQIIFFARFNRSSTLLHLCVSHDITLIYTRYPHEPLSLGSHHLYLHQIHQALYI